MADSPRRTLIHGGVVLTQNDRRDIHQALVIEGDRATESAEQRAGAVP